ncbi:MAG TPA: hypothetical protein DHW63_08435 [Hyphomonadaceae bacterium]|nr:hypothetical protein [Hyphomonadaceae bacterium]
MSGAKRVVLSARAESDLAEIFQSSIERWGEHQARKYAEQIDRRLAVLTKVSGFRRLDPSAGRDLVANISQPSMIFLIDTEIGIETAIELIGQPIKTKTRGPQPEGYSWAHTGCSPTVATATTQFQT